jgi:hypothetical protein
MIARQETMTDKIDIWSAIAAPLPPTAIQWRQDGRPVVRDGRHIARFVAFIDAQFVRERLDSVVPGEWDLTLEPMPPRATFDGEEEQEPYAFKARLQILGVIRESVGQGKDYKTAETDAFKRAAVRFGVGAELYAFGPNWVQMDGDGKYAKPAEDPSVAYARRNGRSTSNGTNGTASGANGAGVKSAAVESASSTGVAPHARTAPEAPQQGAPASAAARTAPVSVENEPLCPKCEGRMWNNTLTKRNPRAPDFKCRDRSCDGVIWPPRDAKSANGADVEESDEPPF